MTLFHSYSKRFGSFEHRIDAPPASDLGLVVVIPCFDEPDLIGSLESLRACERPSCSVEVVVVVNSPVHCSEDVRVRNVRTLEEAALWNDKHGHERLEHGNNLVCHLLHCPDLPAKQAGVGSARKIGMDEAARRLLTVGRPEGIIVCYDADCRCDGNYLTSIEHHFRENPRSPGCSIYFEHPLEGPLEPAIYEAVASYELHLRYYVQALRYAGFPHAHHTVGSSMAVRAAAYLQQGGMNKRQAGEDFYFLQKIIPLGGFADLTSTRVIPSPRPSTRVPFGTGKAVRACLSGLPFRTYPLEAFLDLKAFFGRLSSLLREPEPESTVGALSKPMRDFLRTQDFPDALNTIRGNTATEAAFRKRFHRWFNAFLVMKFIHYARDNFYGDADVIDEAAELAAHWPRSGAALSDRSLRGLLEFYRSLDRSGAP